MRQMSRSTGLLALVAALVVASAGAAFAVGAPPASVEARAGAIVANEHREMAAQTRPQLLAALRVTDKDFHRLERRVILCRFYQAEANAIFRLHQRAMTRAARASAASLRTRNQLLRKALVRLSLVAQRCARVPSPAPPQTPAPEVVPPSTPTPTPITVLRAPVTIANVVNGDTLDVSSTLGPLTLPAAVTTVDVSELSRGNCLARSAICVGIDRGLLSAKLREVMNDNLLLLLLRNVGGLNVSGILAQVNALLTTPDLAPLITVQVVNSRSLRLFPTGLLAELTGLPTIPIAEVGQIQVVR